MVLLFMFLAELYAKRLKLLLAFVHTSFQIMCCCSALERELS
jgi:hypothetical protein